jgi:hypothetical protein
MVLSYKYLALQITSTGNLQHLPKDVCQPLPESRMDCQRNAHSLDQIFPRCQQLFGTLVRPVICYNSEVCGVGFGVQAWQYLKPGTVVPPKIENRQARGHTQILHRFDIKKL